VGLYADCEVGGAAVGAGASVTKQTFNRGIAHKTSHRLRTRIRQLTSVLGYLGRGDLTGLLSRIGHLRRESALIRIQSAQSSASGLQWGILTSKHTVFVAHLIRDRLESLGWSTTVLTEAPVDFELDRYLVICPQIFERLPPPDKRICFQLEQTISPRWFDQTYLGILRESLAVLDYSLVNIDNLEKAGIRFPQVHYLPIGACENYASHVEEDEKVHDVLFYGDSVSSPRRKRMLDAIRSRYRLTIVNGLFGNLMAREIKRAKVIINIHYYDHAILEMPRIQECLSLGTTVVSEGAQDQEDYPELAGAVSFFKEGSIDDMLTAIGSALANSERRTSDSVRKSADRFDFMFKRFLIGMGFLEASRSSVVPIPIASGRSGFVISLPEISERRLALNSSYPGGFVTFPGFRRSPGWIGCGLSHSALARHALESDLAQITIAEDDVVLPPDFLDVYSRIQGYLEARISRWDVFVGLIAVLHPETKVLEVEEHNGLTFVTLSRMNSMVFNIYARAALEVLAAWSAENTDPETNTIDRFMGGRESLRVVTTLPFAFGHREEVSSTLWGFKNSTFKTLIAESEATLTVLVAEFLSNQGRQKSPSRY